jgi:hypothetical protein
MGTKMGLIFLFQPRHSLARLADEHHRLTAVDVQTEKHFVSVGFHTSHTRTSAIFRDINEKHFFKSTVEYISMRSFLSLSL